MSKLAVISIVALPDGVDVEIAEREIEVEERAMV